MSTTESTDTSPGVTSMSAAAGWFVEQPTLPRHESLKMWSEDLTGFLERLIPAVEVLAGSLPEDDVSARAAMVGVGEAHRRLREPGAAGLNGETERVRRLARSVMALCDHHVNLSGTSRPLSVCAGHVPDGRHVRTVENQSHSVQTEVK
ncbi:DUF6415 family natural product biosynthesis protein [Streptomyces sp. NPDC056464]|uniref:DUF6415 family natural product biosynthesis protein n=1 Tax=Streptomyces sp. NPDC056464 TaxID=3345828 RepID=UPI0036CB5954